MAELVLAIVMEIVSRWVLACISQIVVKGAAGVAGWVIIKMLGRISCKVVRSALIIIIIVPVIVTIVYLFIIIREVSESVKRSLPISIVIFKLGTATRTSEVRVVCDVIVAKITPLVQCFHCSINIMAVFSCKCSSAGF